MKKEINLVIKDYRDSFNEPHKKRPYYLHIEYGKKNFGFSNKEKANRFLTLFRNESTFLYKELGNHISSCFSINVSMVKAINHSDYTKISNSLNNLSLKFSNVLVSKSDVLIGREIGILYYELEKIYNYFKAFLSKNNRCNALLERVKMDIKNLKRLRKDFDLLLTSAQGVHEIIKIDS